jgi:lipopolysaccharide/colanic/teichoic acid biosynthesis glycosyltransferase
VERGLVVDALSVNPEPEPHDYIVVRAIGEGCRVFGKREIFCIAAGEEQAPERSFQGSLGRICWRLFEVAVSLLASILTLPVMLVLALVVKRDSPGPALFFQRRMARSRLLSGEEIRNSGEYQILSPCVSRTKKYWVPQTFWFVKFRTMYADARERFPELYDYDMTAEEIKKFQFKVPGDPRVTKAGHWLRESTMDELPNFWNVLRGDMSLVGPRPELSEMIANYRWDQMRKFKVKPGITGLAQISGRGRLAFQDTVAYDLGYVADRSFRLNLRVLLATVWKVVTRHGAF